MNQVACESRIPVLPDFPIFTGDAPNSPLPSYGSKKTEEQWTIEHIAQQIFWNPGSYERRPPSLRENRSLTHLALTKNPQLITQPGALPECFINDPEMIKTALVAAVKLNDSDLKNHLLRDHPEFSELVNRLLSNSNLWDRERDCWTVLVRSNPLLFQFLPSCWHSNEMIAQAASEGDPANFRFYADTASLHRWPVKLLEKILDENHFEYFLTVGQQIALANQIQARSLLSD